MWNCEEMAATTLKIAISCRVYLPFLSELEILRYLLFFLYKTAKI